MRDIAEGSGVNEGGRAVGGLDEIGKNSFCEQDHHSAGRAEVAGAHGSSVASGADDDGIQAFAQIFPVFRKCDDGHDFRSGGDDETGMAAAVFFAIKRNGDAAKGAIVHVHGARPGDALGIKMQIVAVEEMASTRAASKLWAEAMA